MTAQGGRERGARNGRGLRSLYIDFDGFFASVEKQCDPALAHRPVGVTPLDGPNAGLIALCYEARRRGVKPGMRKRDARAVCPDIAIVTARPDVYVSAHHAICRVIERHVPLRGVRSIDEATADLLASEGEDAEGLATRIKRDLARTIGPLVTCSIGFGPNELIAKIAAELHKPDGLGVIEPNDLPEAILHLPLRAIPGIAKGIEGRLLRAGVHDVAELWTLAPKQARALWGSVEGERFHTLLHGGRAERPQTVRRMFGHSRVLPGDWRDASHAYGCARLLTIKAARRMRREGFYASALHYGIRVADRRVPYDPDRERDPWIGHEAVFEHARDDRTFLHALAALHERALARASYSHVGSVSVTLHGLHEGCPQQMELFGEPGMARNKDRWERVADLCDRMHAARGPRFLSLGPRPIEPPGGYAGAKIAFGRIPDMEDFEVTPLPFATRIPIADERTLHYADF